MKEAPQMHHKACDGTECEKFGCVALAAVLVELHDANCGWRFCNGPDNPPENMVTCSTHWAYHDLKAVLR